MRVTGGHRINVHGFFHTRGLHFFEGHCGGVGYGKAISGHHAQHAENVEHRLVDAVGGEVSKSIEEWLIFKLKGPGDGSGEIDSVLFRQIEMAGHDCGCVAGIHYAIAVVVLWITAGRTSRAAFGVGFADHDGLVFQFRK